ncbi:MAG TPA: MgtC/SapB family protein [Chthoniobacterales bacterium]
MFQCAVLIGAASAHWQEEMGVLLRAVAAIGFGGLLGWERTTAGKLAGFRTHMFVCLAAMLFVKLGQFLINDLALHVAPDSLRADPVHIIAAIATGISFLGAGTILRGRHTETARGLTTAASLLISASIGVAVALDRYIIAGGITLLSLFVLHTLLKVEDRILKSKSNG